MPVLIPGPADSQQEGAKRHRGATELVSLCDVPFVLTPEAKAAIFKIEAMVEMNIQVQSWSINVRLPCSRRPCCAQTAPCLMLFSAASLSMGKMP